MQRESFDVLIVGGGQAGIPLAHRLADRGRRVALAERHRLGGSCVNFGCTPTKAALASARLAHQARRAADFGIHIPVVEADFDAVLARARAIAAESRDSLDRGFAKNGVRLLREHARLTGRDGARFLAQAGDFAIDAAQVVLDTGTRTRVPELPGIERVDFLHAGNWLDRPGRPDHVIMLGGGGIALEMSQFYRRMGSRVTLIERSGRLAGREDAEVSAALQRVLEGDGVEVWLEATPERVTPDEPGVRMMVRRGGRAEELRGSHLFVAAGRAPNTDDLGLAHVGVTTNDSGTIRVDERLATSVPGIWAAGDIRGGPQFTHTSWDDHRILLDQIAGGGKRTTRRIVPYAIFTDPELGRVGITEEEARRSNTPHRVLRFDMKSNGRARESGETEGFIRLIVDPGTHRILGAAALTADAGELIHLYVDLMNANAPATVIRDAVHIHPTLAEAYQSVTAELEPAR